jgi:hypothetical protein
MIELTYDQIQAIESNGQQHTEVMNPRTRETFVLVRKDLFDAIQKWAAPLKRCWNNPEDDDLIEK